MKSHLNDWLQDITQTNQVSSLGSKIVKIRMKISEAIHNCTPNK